MKKRIFTLACVTAISLTTVCIACSCGTNSSHAKNDVYYREQSISSPQDRAKDLIPPMPSISDDSSSDSVSDTPTPLPMPEPRPFLPGLPHHRNPVVPPHDDHAPDCSDGSCSGENSSSDSQNPSSDGSAEKQKKKRKRPYAPKEDPVAKAD